MAITSFRGSNMYLSNLSGAIVNYGGLTYGSSEAAFQAQKCKDPNLRVLFTAMGPMESKKYGRAKVQLRPDWEDIKVRVMYEVIYAKFTQNEGLKARLIATGDEVLEERLLHAGGFWDMNLKGEGGNVTGKILMSVRNAIKKI